MKILSVIKRTYDDTLPFYELLKVKVDGIVTNIKNPKWHYISRIKELKSYALKLETGRFEDPSRLEDFFACTLVVENKKDIRTAIRLLEMHFDINSRRPKNDSYTHKNPESFEFDDLRLYLKLKTTAALPSGPINDVVFEMQVKTFLQHAWSVATHDLIYKSDEIYWARHRVAYQVKAILESAEVSIEKANEVKKLSGIPEANRQFKETVKTMDFLKAYFETEQLPSDMIRLAQNVNVLLRAIDTSLEQLEKVLEKDEKELRGKFTTNLSPYMVIVQALIFKQKTKMQAFIRSGPKNDVKLKLFLTGDIDLNGLKDIETSKHMIFLK